MPRPDPDRHDERGLRRHDDHWRWVGGPVPRGSAGITLGPLMIVRSDAASSRRLIRHERVHVRQWRDAGLLKFIASYLTSYLRWRLRGYPHAGAYRRIPAEIEAYWLERNEDLPG